MSSYLGVSDGEVIRVGFDLFPSSVFRQDVGADLGVVEVAPDQLVAVRRPPDGVVVLDDLFFEDPVGDAVEHLKVNGNKINSVFAAL